MSLPMLEHLQPLPHVLELRTMPNNLHPSHTSLGLILHYSMLLISPVVVAVVFLELVLLENNYQYKARLWTPQEIQQSKQPGSSVVYKKEREVWHKEKRRVSFEDDEEKGCIHWNSWEKKGEGRREILPELLLSETFLEHGMSCLSGWLSNQ